MSRTEQKQSFETEQELAIQKQWSEVRRGTAFTLLNGVSLRVLSPGRWNRMTGPDFRNAKLELNGTVLRGDVEVHGKTSDWIAHGHGGDPAYDNVILHVVRRDDTSPGNVAFLPESAVLVLPEAGEGDAETETKPQAACAAYFAKMTPDEQEAFYAKKRRVPMRESTGLVAGEFVMSYPPGIPIVAPGERITPDVLEHILFAKEKGCFMTGTEDMNLDFINVVE